jgi:PTH1 family peptidyl-tRNA hydrolase
VFKPASDKYLIVGLGNPGREYRHHRHNIGFLLLDRFIEKHHLPSFTRSQSRALVTSGSVADRSVVLVKPQTYMNLSGEAVGSLVRFYDIALERMLVCYDDIDIPLGIIRMRARGTSGGQRGMQSIIDHLSSNAFPRLRIGVGRPAGQTGASTHVLRDFRPEEIEVVQPAIETAVDAIDCYIENGVELAMSRYNGPPDRDR